MSSCAWAGESTTRRSAALGLLGAGLLAGALVLAAERPAVSLVDDAHPYVALDREIAAQFGMERPVVWILEARGETLWTPRGLARLQELTREVFRVPGVIAPDVVSLASPNLRDLRITDGGLEPVYLMGRVPEAPEEIAALRARVEGDPMFRGTLTSVDGTAAMIVANFRTDASAADVASAALGLRDRYDDEETRAFVLGEPLAAGMAASATGTLALVAAMAVGLPLVALFWRLGVRAAPAVFLVGLSASGLAAAGAWLLGALVFPWAAGPIGLAGAIAGRAARADGAALRALAGTATGGLVGFATSAALVARPAATFAACGAVACAAALLGGHLGRWAFGLEPAVPAAPSRRRRAAIAVLLVVAATGVALLRPELGRAGYGRRYLPAHATGGLEALERLFPPPTQLALRVRGEPGFVASPEVLASFDHIRVALEDDPDVRQTTSLADLVKLVHRSFNDGEEEFFAIPDDRALIARYLALAYSPGFRRFVDRAQETAAVWIAVGTDSPAALGRVAGRVDRALDEIPVPGARVERFGGDGAEILHMAETARGAALAGALAWVAALAGAGLAGGRSVILSSLGRSVAAGLVAAGAFGWLGLGLDLVTIPLLAAVTVGGALWPAADRSRLSERWA